MFGRFIRRIKSNKTLFQNLANRLYKFFNVIERGDNVILAYGRDINGDVKGRIFRVLDIYNDGSFDVVCDSADMPMRTKVSLKNGIQLYKKFFKGDEFKRDPKHDNGWRLADIGGIGKVFYNFKNKKVLKLGGKK